MESGGGYNLVVAWQEFGHPPFFLLAVSVAAVRWEV